MRLNSFEDGYKAFGMSFFISPPRSPEPPVISNSVSLNIFKWFVGR